MVEHSNFEMPGSKQVSSISPWGTIHSLVSKYHYRTNTATTVISLQSFWSFGQWDLFQCGKVAAGFKLALCRLIKTEGKKCSSLLFFLSCSIASLRFLLVRSEDLLSPNSQIMKVENCKRMNFRRV